VKNGKATSKKGEVLSLETVQSSSLFTEPTASIPPIQSAPYREGELEEAIEDFEVQPEETELVAEEEDEVSVDQGHQEEVIFQPQDITWEYLKGLEKISLLTPEKEVGLAKRIKEGERQVKILETKTLRLKTKLFPSSIPKNGGKKISINAKQGYKLKGKNGKNGKKIKTHFFRNEGEKSSL
jgi:hypothetical protein